MWPTLGASTPIAGGPAPPRHGEVPPVRHASPRKAYLRTNRALRIPLTPLHTSPHRLRLAAPAPANLTEQPRLRRRARHPAPYGPVQTTLEGHLCHALAAQPEPKPNQGRNRPISSRQRALRRRATISDGHHALSPEPPPCCSQCVTHAMWRLPSPTTSRLGPCSARFASSGQAPLRRSAPATFRRRPARPTRPGHSIRSLRPRLDPTLTKSWPSDLDLTAVIRAYRFGWCFC